MKNLTKALGIAGITALSFLPMNGKGQNNLKEYNKENKSVYRDLATLALQKGKLSTEYTKKPAYVYESCNPNTKELFSVCFDNTKNRLYVIYRSLGKTIVYYDKNSNGLNKIKSIDLNMMTKCSSSKLASFFQRDGRDFLYTHANLYTDISKIILEQ